MDVPFTAARARNVGDTLTIVIAEKTDASKRSNTNTERSSNNSFAVTGADETSSAPLSFDPVRGWPSMSNVTAG